MDPQLLIVSLIVSAAALYLGRRSWRTWTGKKSGCGKGCDCSGTKAGARSALISTDELTARMAKQSAAKK